MTSLEYRLIYGAQREDSLYSDRDRMSYQPNSYFDGFSGETTLERNFRMITPITIDILTLKMDYSQPLWGGELGIGGKYSLVATENTFSFFDVQEGEDQFNPDRSNIFDYSENV